MRVTGRKSLPPELQSGLPPVEAGLECVVLADGVVAGTPRFRDAPRPDSRPFLKHLRPRHGVAKVMIVSGDREAEVRWLAAATVGVAIGPNSDVTSEAAGAVVMTASLAKLDDLIHVGERMRAIALQSTVGGMLLSLIGMILAASGRLTPLEGAVAQEVIDLAAVLNAVRVALPPRSLGDF